jgi:hypothetical protein
MLKTASSVVLSHMSPCGLAWDKARLGAPGWVGEKRRLF